MGADREANDLDVVVVGAGVAGAACARFLAEGGRRVALVDRRPRASAGARWVNGVPSAVFDEVGLARPLPPELRGAGHRFVVAPPSGRARVTIDDNPIAEVDMRLLGDRLRAGAVAAGARLLDETAVDGVLVADGRVRALETRHGTLRAPLFVDASGLPAVVRRAVFPRWPDVSRGDLCLAAQQVHEIADDAGAARFLATHELDDGAVIAWTGTHGGYSVLNVRVERGKGEVGVLTGAVPDSGTSGVAMIDEFIGRERWIGARVFGGAGALPLRRPYARLVAPGLALLGDAGSQMFPAHGSGIAIGLRAARLLADVVLDAPIERAGDHELLWRYAARFHRRHAGTLQGYDVVRRMAQAFSRDESEELFWAGLASPRTTRAALAQELPRLDPREVIATLRGAARAPRLAVKVAAALGKLPFLVANALTYPTTPDLGALARYERRVARLVGDDVDPIA